MAEGRYGRGEDRDPYGSSFGRREHREDNQDRDYYGRTIERAGRDREDLRGTDRNMSDRGGDDRHRDSHGAYGWGCDDDRRSGGYVGPYREGGRGSLYDDRFDRGGMSGSGYRGDEAWDRAYGGGRDQESHFGRPGREPQPRQGPLYGRQQDRYGQNRNDDRNRTDQGGYGGSMSDRGYEQRGTERGYQGFAERGRYDQPDWYRDENYHALRERRLRELDREYEEFRSHRQERMAADFDEWRRSRQLGQAGGVDMSRVREHMEVVGSDGGHVGTVDCIEGDRIKLTRSDQAAGGQHHSIPLTLVRSVDDKVRLSLTVEEAKREWRTEQGPVGDTKFQSAGVGATDTAATGTASSSPASTTGTSATPTGSAEPNQAADAMKGAGGGKRSGGK